MYYIIYTLRFFHVHAFLSNRPCFTNNFTSTGLILVSLNGQLKNIYDRSNLFMAALFGKFSDLKNYLMFMLIEVYWPLQHFLEFIRSYLSFILSLPSICIYNLQLEHEDKSSKVKKSNSLEKLVLICDLVF